VAFKSEHPERHEKESLAVHDSAADGRPSVPNCSHCGKRETVERSGSFNVFFCHSLIPLYIFDQETLQLLEVNDATILQYGYTRKELLQLYATEFHPNEDVARFVAFLRDQVPQLLAHGGMNKWHTTVMWKQRRKNGTPLDVYISIHAVTFAGRPAVAVSAFDMTEQLRVDSTLRYSADLVYQLTDNLDAVFWVAEPNLSRFLYISAAYEKVWERNRAHLYAKPWAFLEAIHPEDVARVMKTAQANLAPLDLEFRIRRPNGEVRWIHGRSFPVCGTDGEIIRIAGITEDITERKQHADQLRYSEEQLRQLTENITAVLWVSTADGEQTLYVSPAYEKIWGKSLASAYESPWSFSEVIHPEDRERVLAVLLRGWTAEREPLEHEYRILQPSGEVIWIRERIFPVKNEYGEVARIVGISEDISAQKEAQAVLENVSRQLIVAQEAERRYFASELHDEIGQTLTALKISVESLVQDAAPHLRPRLLESVRMIDGTIEQVRNLCLDLRPSQLDDLGLLPTLEWYVDRQRQRTGLMIHLKIAPFPRQAPLIETTCFRIVQEALTNVARHARTREAWVHLQPRGGKLELVIFDRGIGGDPEVMRDRARQGHSSGILGMEKRVRLVGGHFELIARPNRGVRIRVILPRHTEHESAEEVATQIDPPRKKSDRSRKTSTAKQMKMNR
jgi:PAS domain S-box-containing protein